MPTLSIGQSFGQYQIVGILGRGRATVSYVAEQPSLGRKVVIKAMTRSTEFPQAVERFAQAVQQAAQLDDAGIPPIYEAPQSADALLLVEKYIAGGPLLDQLDQPLPGTRIADILTALARTLDAFRERGLAHGRLTPNNVLLSGDTDPLLDDFVFAQVLGGTLASGASFDAYLAPEQRAGQAATPPTDVYALGVLALHMASGKEPSGDLSQPSVLKEHLSAVQLDEAARAALSTAFSANPGYRQPNAAVFALAWQPKLDKTDIVTSRRRRRVHPVEPARGWPLAVIAMLALLAVASAPVVVALWPKTASGPTPDPCKQTVDAKVAQAQLATVNEKFPEARATYNEVLACDPGNILATNGLADVNEREQWPGLVDAGQNAFIGEDYPTAIAKWEAVYGKDPKYRGVSDKLYNAYLKNGENLVSKGNVADALSAFDGALKIHPADPAATPQRQRAAAWVGAVKAYEQQSWSEASAAFEGLYKTVPSYQQNLPALLFNSYVNLAGTTWSASRSCAETLSILNKAIAIPGLDHGPADSLHDTVDAACATPTPTPSPTPTYAPVPPPPLHYCFVPAFVSRDAYPGGIVIVGKVTDRTGKGIPGIVVQVRPNAGGPTVYAQSVPGGDYNYHGLQGAADWLIKLRDFESIETLISFTQDGQIITVNIQEKPCPQ